MLIIYGGVLLVFPALTLWLAHHSQWANKVGVIVMCYLAGMVAGNSGIFPSQVLAAQEGVSEAAIALALPMLLFTLDIKKWRAVAGKAMLSMVLATASVVALSTSLFFAFRQQGAQEASNLAAMSIGVYTGGTPNLAAIKAGLDIPHSEYIVFHSLDTVVGAVYMLGMLTVGIPLFRLFLRRPIVLSQSSQQGEPTFDEDDFRALLEKRNLPQLARIAALSIAILLLSLAVSRLLQSLLSLQDGSALVIIALTTSGILASLVPAVRKMELAYKLGMYLIYVFCFTVASMAKFSDLQQLDATIAIFLVVTVFGSLLLHALLCKLANVDSDTFMVTSVAAVCSPPFVPMIAKALGNPGTILSGMTTGIIGYALGNYLGISLALLLKGL